MTVPPTPAEGFATLVQWLGQAAVAMMGGERLPLLLISQIVDRLRRIKQRFSLVDARINAGTYVPRRRETPPRGRPGQSPPPPSKLPQTFGWLLKLVPDAVGYRSQLENLFRDAEKAALLAAAPAPMGRALRPLCRMLGLPPPDILGPPQKARPPKPPPPPPRTEEAGGAEERPVRQRRERQRPPRYVFGLCYPPPFPDPA